MVTLFCGSVLSQGFALQHLLCVIEQPSSLFHIYLRLPLAVKKYLASSCHPS